MNNYKVFIKSNKKTIINILWRFIEVFSKQGIPFIIFILASINLNNYDLGIYSYTLAIISLIVLFSDFGISFSTSKFVAEYTESSKEKIPYVFFNATLPIFILSIIIFIIFIIFGKQWFGDNVNNIYIVLPLILIAPANGVLDGIYRGLDKFKKLSLSTVLAGIISIVLSYILVTKIGLFGALLSQLLFNFLIFIFLIIGLEKIHFKLNKKIIVDIGKYAFLIGISGIGAFLFSRVDIIFLGNYSYFTEIGYYEVIFKILTLILIPFSVIAQVLSPEITKSYVNNNHKLIIKKFKLLLIFTFLSAVIISGSLFFAQNIVFHFLSKFDTQEMRIMYNAMLIVYFTQILVSIIPTAFSYAVGNAKLNMIFLIIFGCLNTVLDYLFINIFGAIGIIYASVVTKLLSDFLFTYFCYIGLLRKIETKHDNIHVPL